MASASLERESSILTSTPPRPRIFPHCSHKLRKFNVSLAPLSAKGAMIAPYFRTSRQENPRIYPQKKPAGEEDSVDNIRSRDWALLKLVGYYEWISVSSFLSGQCNPLAGAAPPANLEVDRHFAKAAAFSKKKRRTISALVFSSYQVTAAR